MHATLPQCTFYCACMSDLILHVYDFMHTNITDLQEEFCFGEENAAVNSFLTVVVDVTRSGPACGATSISLCLSIGNNETVVCKYA